MQSTLAVNVEPTPAEEPAVIQQRPAEPVVQQAETEIVDETKYVRYCKMHICRMCQIFTSRIKL